MFNFHTFLGQKCSVYFHTFLPWSSQSSPCISSCSHNVFYSFRNTLHSFVFKKRAKTAIENVSLLSTFRAIQLFLVTFFPWLYFLPRTVTFFCDFIPTFLHLSWIKPCFYLCLETLCCLFELLNPEFHLLSASESCCYQTASSCIGWHDKVVA